VTDRIGARRALAGGLTLFVLASAACALAPGLAALVAARFVQGSAAAAVMPSSMALIRQAFPDAVARGRALAVWAMGGAIASSSGPVLGGVLELVDWRMIFVINLPVGAAALAFLARIPAFPRRPVSFDVVRQFTAVLAMGGLTYGAIEAGAARVRRPFGAGRVRHRRRGGSGIRQVGGALAVAVFGGLLAQPDTFMIGFHASLLIAAAVLAAATVAAATLRPVHKPRRS
jgi:MFS family permease